MAEKYQKISHKHSAQRRYELLMSIGTASYPGALSLNTVYREISNKVASARGLFRAPAIFATDLYKNTDLSNIFFF